MFSTPGIYSFPDICAFPVEILTKIFSCCETPELIKIICKTCKKFLEISQTIVSDRYKEGLLKYKAHLALTEELQKFLKNKYQEFFDESLIDAYFLSLPAELDTLKDETKKDISELTINELAQITQRCRKAIMPLFHCGGMLYQFAHKIRQISLKQIFSKELLNQSDSQTLISEWNEAFFAELALQKGTKAKKNPDKPSLENAMICARLFFIGKADACHNKDIINSIIVNYSNTLEFFRAFQENSIGYAPNKLATGQEPKQLCFRISQERLHVVFEKILGKKTFVQRLKKIEDNFKEKMGKNFIQSSPCASVHDSPQASRD